MSNFWEILKKLWYRLGALAIASMIVAGFLTFGGYGCVSDDPIYGQSNCEGYHEGTPLQFLTRSFGFYVFGYFSYLLLNQKDE